MIRMPMPPVEFLTGPPAFSRARLDEKLRELKLLDRRVDGVFAEFVHFLLLGGALDGGQRETVGALLRYGPRHDLPERVGEPFCVVMPRSGTVSPWSSKATDIFRRCGLDAVIRVERGVRWHLASETAKPARLPPDTPTRERPARPDDRDGRLRRQLRWPDRHDGSKARGSRPAR